MSLLVWLPLNGNLYNLGLDGIYPINHGATIDDNGKIGKCYSFSGSNSISLAKVILPSLTPNWSFSCWFYLANTTTTTATCLFSERAATNNAGYTIFIYPNTGRILVDDGARWDITPMAFSASTWYHLTITRSPNEKKLYINGELKNSTSTVGNTSTINNNGCLIGLAQSGTALATGNQGFIGKLNDVRIYDHTLSAKEVEELSKALVLHYKLDNYITTDTVINPNLLQDTNVSSLTKVKASYNRYFLSASSGTYTAEFETISDPPSPGIVYGVHYNVTVADGYHGLAFYSSNGRVNVTSEQQYTLSCYAKKLSEDNVTLRFLHGKSPYKSKDITMINDNEWHQYSWTFTPSTGAGEADADGTTRIYGAGPLTTGEVIVCGYKFESGDTATPWCEHNTPINNSIVPDCSGYNHNGVIIGAAELQTNSARYNYGIYMNNVNLTSHIECSDIITLPTDGITVSFWAYITKTNTYILYIDLNMSFAVNSAGTAFYISRSSAAGFPLTEFKTNLWNHVVLIRNNDTYKAYINGKNITADLTTSSTSWTHSIPRLYLLNRYYNTSYGANAIISDFRMYATELTESQIQELYNTSATIDNTGNIYAREFNTTNTISNPNITKTGIMQPVDIIQERDELFASIEKDNDILGWLFYEY